MAVKILVLEDNPQRIRWLARAVGPDVYWTSEVDEFLEWAPMHRFDLMILDHDLGTKQTGLDAALELQIPRNSLILVWSTNPVGGPLMVSTLRQRGFWEVRHTPFGRPELFPMIRRLVRRAA